MIVPHEVTFWNDRDDVTIVNGDPLYRQKADFLAKNNVVIFRMHDHMHDQRPDFLYVGSARELGLDAKHETAHDSHRFTIPETTLGRLAAEVKTRVGARALRVVGHHETLRLGELAQHLRVAPRSVTDVVDALEERGLAERTPDPTDRRAHVVRLTPAGTRLVAEVDAARRAGAEEYFGRLPDRDRATLRRILERLDATD